LRSSRPKRSGPFPHSRSRLRRLSIAGRVAALDSLCKRTGRGDFTGFIQWDRRACVAADELAGRTAEGPLRVRFETIRSIARRWRDSSLVTVRDGRDIVLSGTRAVGEANSGIYVDDPRCGRVLLPWDAFERVDFSAGGSGPGSLGGPLAINLDAAE
jgi:hypothetical protein